MKPYLYFNDSIFFVGTQQTPDLLLLPISAEQSFYSSYYWYLILKSVERSTHDCSGQTTLLNESARHQTPSEASVCFDVIILCSSLWSWPWFIYFQIQNAFYQGQTDPQGLFFWHHQHTPQPQILVMANHNRYVWTQYTRDFRWWWNSPYYYTPYYILFSKYTTITNI